jgi:MerR family transcriptional regulator/heat shock protein HspR
MSLDTTRESCCTVVVAAWLAGMSVGRVRRLLRYGLVRAPLVDERGAPLFGEAELARLRKIRRLIDDLGVNLAGVDIIVRLADELAHLRVERPWRS